MKNCPKCNLSHENKGTFCSKKCANSRSWSEDDKKKKSISVKKFHKQNPDVKFIIAEKNRKPKKRTICIICEKEFEGTKKTCSKECFSENQRSNALKQIKHGGGKKGKYKNIFCDSTYELAFLIYHLDKGIPIKRCKEKRHYIHNERAGVYVPDFVVEDQIYEIKGFMSGCAKSKAAYNPDVIIIDKLEIRKYIKYVKDTYNTKLIYDLYDDAVKKNCVVCDKQFTAKRETQKSCSRICNGKISPSIETRAKLSKISKDKWLERRDSNAQ